MRSARNAVSYYSVNSVVLALPSLCSIRAVAKPTRSPVTNSATWTGATTAWPKSRSLARNSMRQQHWRSHLCDQRAGDAAEHQFARPRMPIGTGDDEIGTNVGGIR